MTSIGVDTVEVLTLIHPKRTLPSTLLRPNKWGKPNTGQKRCPRLGKMVDCQGIAGPRGTYLTLVPETRELTLRLSIPRLAYPRGLATVNTPLRPHRQDILQTICRDVLYVLGAAAPNGVDPCVALGIMDWVVIKCDFAADVSVSDTVEAFSSLATLERKRSKTVHTWSVKGIKTGLDWQTSDHSFCLYDKARELFARKTRNEAEQSLVRSIAANMQNVIRLEVACKTTRGIRHLLDLRDGSLPSLGRILQPDVASYALGKELDRLGLMSASGHSRARGSEDRALGMEFLAARNRLEESGEQLGRHKSISGSRLMLLMGYYRVSRDFTLDELKSKFGLSDSTRRELESDLKGLGLPPMLGKSRTNREVLAEIVNALRPLVTLTLPILYEKDLGFPPWALEEEAEEAAKTTLVTASDFAEILLDL